MIDTIAVKLARSIKRANPEQTASLEMLTYSLNLVLNPVAIFVCSTLIGLLIGRLTDIYIALLAFGVLRAFSGGYHFKSSQHCVLITSVAAGLISFFHFDDAAITVMTVISILLVLFFAPNSIKQTTLIPIRYNPLLKIMSAVIVSSTFLFYSSAMCMAFLLQSISLVHLKKGG